MLLGALVPRFLPMSDGALSLRKKGEVQEHDFRRAIVMQAKSSIVDPPRLPSFPHSINNCLAPGGHFIVILAAMAVTSFTSLLQAFVFGLWLYINAYFDYKKNKERRY